MTDEVFINYRGEDSHSYGALLYTDFSRHFGADLVFLDSQSIPAGSDFAEQLLVRARRATVLLAVIGPRWLTTADSQGRPRVDDPADWIRRELAEAFAAGVSVIPVLTDDASPLVEADLPAEIARLGRCQFRRLRHRDVTADLDRLRADLTAAHPVLADAARRRSAARSPAVVPAQLLRDVYGFAGRNEHLARLDTLLAGGAAEAPTAVVITAVSGTPGVGKTALAVHWAHRVADQFPDGQLYVNLRGYHQGGQVLEPAQALRGFIEALGVPAERIPAYLDAQAALYRSLLAGKRVLVVLDNARDAEQVRPLLPGTPTALVLVTSRNQLTPLVATDGAHPLTLDVLSTVEARELLERRLGPGRLAAEPAAVNAIIAACAGLPLALSIAAARGAQTGFPLAALAAELSDAQRRLAALDAGDPASRVRAVFSWSYTALSPPSARLFRLLGLHPGPDTSVPAAASLAGVLPSEAGPLLAELTCASLTAEHAPGRYSFHDLLAAYATDLALSTETDDERRAATGRLLDHYTHSAHIAERLLFPAGDPIPLPLSPPVPGTRPEQPTGAREAMVWMAVERPVLLAALRLAAAAGYDAHSWQLAWALTTFLQRQARWQDMVGAWRAAVAAADRLSHPAAAAHAHRQLARASSRLGRFGEAHAHLHRALDLHTLAGDQAGQAHTHHSLALLWEQQGRPDRALDHAQQAVTLHQAVGHRNGQAHALNAVGWCHVRLGDHRQAVTHCQQALALLEQIGDRYGQAHTWDSLGYAYHHLDQHSRATDCYEHALDLFHDLDDRYAEASTLARLGDTRRSAGDPGAARAAWTRALDILTELDHPDAADVRAKLHDLDRLPHHDARIDA